MDLTILAPWRDIAVVLLVIEAAVIVAVPGVAFFFVLKGVRAVKRWLVSPLLQAQVWALRIQHGTLRTTNAIAAVPIAINGKAVQANVTTRGIIDFLLGHQVQPNK
jgi:hypothetical protein